MAKPSIWPTQHCSVAP